MALAKFIPNYPAIQLIKKMPLVQAAVRAKAERAENTAKQLAAAHVVSGEYLASIRLEEEGDGVTLVSDSGHSVAVEFGTDDTAAQAILRRAVSDSEIGEFASPEDVLNA